MTQVVTDQFLTLSLLRLPRPCLAFSQLNTLRAIFFLLSLFYWLSPPPLMYILLTCPKWSFNHVSHFKSILISSMLAAASPSQSPEFGASENCPRFSPDFVKHMKQKKGGEMRKGNWESYILLLLCLTNTNGEWTASHIPTGMCRKKNVVSLCWPFL